MFRLSAQGGAREPMFKKTSTSSCSFYDSKKYTWLQCKKRQIQTPGTTFSTFSDEVRLEGGHGNWCRFCHTHGSAPRSPYLPCQIMVQRKSSELKNNYGISCRKNWEAGVVPVVDLIAHSAKKTFFCGQFNTGVRHSELFWQKKDTVPLPEHASTLL